MWQPSFDPNNRRLRWLFCILGGVYLNLFILFFTPYDGVIFAYTVPFYYQFVFGGIITLVFSFTGIGLPALFPRFFMAPHFTVKRFLVWFTVSGLLCHIPSFFYDNWLLNIENTWDWFFTYEIKYAIPTLIFISIPFLIALAFIFSKKELEGLPINKADIKDTSKAHLVETPIVSVNSVDGLAEIIPPQYDAIKSNNSIKLIDFSGKNIFETTREQLIYITSANNYVEIFYTDNNDVPARTLLRQTLTEIDNQLVTTDNSFCRCHKTYIINKEKIISITGNAKGYQLILSGCTKPIPVSRTKNDKLIATYIHLLDT